jgi:hypothetical protein
MSAALGYWVTHDRHRLAQPAPRVAVDDDRPSLQKNTLVYCPICGESFPTEDAYRTHRHEPPASQAGVEWKRNDE